MRVALAFARNRLATGVDRYARDLGAALRALGVEARDLVLERREARVGPVRFGGLASMWAQRLRASAREGELLHALDPAVATRDADVVTVHDLIPEQTPPASAAARLDWALSRALSRRSAWFVTPSAATRDALVERWEADPARVVVSHHGIDSNVFRPSPSGSPWLAKGRPTVAYVGDDHPRKNLPLVVRAIADVNARLGLDVRLVRVGPVRFPAAHAELRRLATDARVDLVEPGYLADADLARLLTGAAAFAWPSKGEGFGLPPLEALACGTPVVALDIPVTREVCGPLARYHADDPGSCADALADVLARPPDREKLVGYASAFTWEASARRHLAVYERALEARR